MGEKTRTNYRINICLKEDCISRPLKCDKCFAYNEYKSKKYCTCKGLITHSGGFVLATQKELIICNNCGKEMKI